MRRPLSLVTVVFFMLIGATVAHANAISYTFTGDGGVTGTEWTLVDPNGYIPVGTNVVNLLTESTNFFSLGVDYGPLIGIGDAGDKSGNPVCISAGTPCFEINMAISYLGGPFVIPFFFAGTDGTSGTFKEIETGSTLTVGPAPEPGSAVLMLLGLGLLGLMMLRQSRNARRRLETRNSVA
jgi:hypothetical protein